jgi:hypothetical protein
VCNLQPPVFSNLEAQRFCLSSTGSCSSVNHIYLALDSAASYCSHGRHYYHGSDGNINVVFADLNFSSVDNVVERKHVYGFVSSGTSNRKCEFSWIPEWWHSFRIFL